MIPNLTCDRAQPATKLRFFQLLGIYFVFFNNSEPFPILDHENLTKEDNVSSFLAPPDQVGKNRAQASLERLQQRNPMVEITADKENLEAKEKDFFR